MLALLAAALVAVTWTSPGKGQLGIITIEASVASYTTAAWDETQPRPVAVVIEENGVRSEWLVDGRAFTWRGDGIDVHGRQRPRKMYARRQHGRRTR